MCRCGVGGFADLPLVETAHAGWWTLSLGPAVVHVVDASLLASDGTWGIVRFIANPPPRTPDENLFEELLLDPRLTVDVATRMALALVEGGIEPNGEAMLRSAEAFLAAHPPDAQRRDDAAEPAR